MRIGFDLLGLQSPQSRGRGIGRYCGSLMRAILAGSRKHDYLLYTYESLPEESDLAGERVRGRLLPGGSGAAGAIQEVASRNPDGLDYLVILSPFEMHWGYAPPASEPGGLPIAAVVYDLIPFLFQEKYLDYPPTAMPFYRNLERLRAYRSLLAISEATAADTRRLLGLGPDRARSISGASEPGFFTPETMAAKDESEGSALKQLGISRPFVFCLASGDDRKNVSGLLAAFARLPERLRAIHQIVVGCSLSENEAARLRAMAGSLGISQSLVLTGAISDELLRDLYRRCAVFAFPSHYEGFGLPILEAMLCGAVVVAGKNSSQIEVAGEAALLANTHDSQDIATAMERVLTDRGLAERLRLSGFEQASKFSWDKVARKAIEALEGTATQGSVQRSRATTTRRIAYFSPFPPKETGISEYSVSLTDALARRSEVEIFHDEGYVPDLGPGHPVRAGFNVGAYSAIRAARGYDAALYQVGNSHYHHGILGCLGRHPGIVTLHDYYLTGYHWWLAHQPELHDAPSIADFFRREIAEQEPDRAGDFIRRIELLEKNEELSGLERALVNWGVPLNRKVLRQAEALIVHSRWAAARLAEVEPSRASMIHVVPLGADPRPIDLLRQAEYRQRFGLPVDALILASFGILHSQKMNTEAIQAFSAIAREHPSALLLFVGPDHTQGAALREVQRHGLLDRVRFVGHQSDERFQQFLEVPDVGIALRRAPTNGETSAALLHLLRRGVPTIVSDVDAFSDFPDDVARKVRIEEEGNIGPLVQALAGLVGDRQARQRLGASALDYVERFHRWDHVAGLYLEVIEKTRWARLRGPGQKGAA